ncbi:MAG: IS1380 family transposase, partial [Gammaproteobacteria bacterium]
GHYCYLPLYIFCGEHLLCARLRSADQEAAAGTTDELERIVGRIREVWPKVRVVLRGDSGFCRETIMNWCEDRGVEYVSGLAKNARLKREVAAEMTQARAEYQTTCSAARVFKDFRYRTLDSWSRDRRVAGKAGYLAKGENPRFIVTSLAIEEFDAKTLYEAVYCARGEMENRIKEQQPGLFADRTSTKVLRSNQLRLYFASFAYVLMQALRRLALAGTTMAKARCQTIRVKIFKNGTQLRITVRKVRLSFSEGYPFAALFLTASGNLQRIRRCAN